MRETVKEIQYYSNTSLSLQMGAGRMRYTIAIIRFLMQGNNYSGPADVLECPTTFNPRLCLDNLEKSGRRRIACERQFNKIACQKCETRQLS